MQKIFRGRGCKSCPVKNCDTSQYRGSRCTALRARYGEDDPENVSKYDIDFRGVHCSGVMWGLEPYVFLFERNGFKYEYEQPRYIESSADTDHIRIVIGLFLEQLADNALASEDSRREADKRGAPVKIPRMTANITPEELQNAIQDFEDEAYASSGSVTGHHATRAGYAFKWPDESKTTPLDHIEWSCATSVITPVAVFDPVQLEGTTVSRASLVNISEMERLGIGANGKTWVEVIKANKIIPKVIGVKQAEGTFEIPEFCPVCGEKTEVRISTAMKRTVKTLVCTNPDCAAKKLKKFVRFVSKEGLDIDGLSIETLRVLISRGFIHEFSDIFALKYHAAEISKLDGFGERSCEKLLQAIEKSRDVDAVNLIKSLSVPMVGRDAAKRIFAAIGFDGFTKAIQTPGERFERIPGIGPERSKAITDWFSDIKNADEFSHLMCEVRIKNADNKVNSGGRCMGITFVITGEVHHYPNRDAFKAYVESEGGKVSGSVSKKTDYLVNNDVNSTSGKNKKAKELGVPIISEDEFVSKFVR